MHPDVRILPWDSNLFGFPVGRIEQAGPGGRRLQAVLEELRRKNVRLAYWECPTDDDAAVEEGRRLGGLLINRKAVLERKMEPPFLEGCDIEELADDCSPQDRKDLIDLAFAAGGQSRFRLDPKVPASIFNQLYRAWMEKSLAGEIADTVLVERAGARVAGMITLSLDDGVGQIGLFGVSEAARGKGFGRKLLRGSLFWLSARPCRAVRVVTQGENEAALAVYAKTGFQTITLCNIFHFWL